MTVYIPQAIYDEMVEAGRDMSNFAPAMTPARTASLKAVRYVNREARRAAARARRRKA